MLLHSFGHQGIFRGQVKKCYKLASGAIHRGFRQPVDTLIVPGAKKIHGWGEPVGRMRRFLGTPTKMVK